ncbi:MAG: hypothetical protein BGO98_42955 [Myxococcales bacterium 68-20]|nr:MAG: hypothetical protein BGO98_42955 [Myxococcales bacterium 68-20]
MIPGMRRAFLTTAFVAAIVATGCSSVGGSAIRTGPVQLPAYTGPVAIYAMGQPPPGAVDLGVVEVHAAQQEASIDNLLPQFVRKVAQIGGNVAVIEGTRARFDLAGRSHVETFYYTCGMGATCAGTRMYSTNEEIMTVSMFGRAMTTQLPGTSGPPLIPPGPPPPPDDENESTPEPREKDSAPESERPEIETAPPPQGAPSSGRDLGGQR